MSSRKFSGKLNELTGLRTSFGPELNNVKLNLLGSIEKQKQFTVKQLMNYHELLLFIMAYPDSKEIYQTAVKELKRISGILQKQVSQKHQSIRFKESGMAFTEVSMPPSIKGSEWIIDTLKNDVTPVPDSEFTDKIGPMLSLFALPSEMDGLTNNNYDALDWIRLKSGDEKNKRPYTQLSWLIKSVKKAFPEIQQQDHIWEELSVNVRVKLSDPALSRTLNFIETPDPFIQTSPLIRTVDVNKYIVKRDCIIRKPGRSLTKQVIRSARAALLSRGRETDPVTYAQKVTEIVTGRGLTVYLFTMDPERRLPLENYTGFTAYKNGVPVGYGGGWIFGYRCEIGVNIFETFRGGENYLLFASIMKAYTAVFNVRRFTVAPYQFGEGNQEGIETGAYWFYYKLGFRSADREIALTAEKESLKMRANKKYRSSEKTLIKFTESPLYFDTGNRYSQIEPGTIGICISKWISSQFKGDQLKAKKFSTDYVISRLPSGIYKKWNRFEKQSFQSLAPLIAMTQCLDKMSKNDDVLELAEMMKEKGNDEILHSLLLQKNKILLPALKESVKKYIR